MDKFILHIKVDSYSNIKRVLILLSLLEVNFFSLLGYVGIDQVISRYLVGGIGAMWFIYFVLKYSLIEKIKGYTVFINFYIVGTILILAVHTIYGMMEYDQTFLDVYYMSNHFLRVLLCYPIIYLMVSDRGVEKPFNIVAKIGFIYTILIIIRALFLTSSGKDIFPLLGQVYMRDGNIRIILPILGLFGTIYHFYKLLTIDTTKKRLQYLCMVIIELYCIFWIVQTRMLTIAMTITLLLMWFIKKRTLNLRVLSIMVIVIGIVLILTSGYFQNLISSFSTTSDKGTSTIARTEAIEYFKTYTDKNILLGMGFVRPYTSRLMKIWSGPNGTAYFDDIGFLGLFFKTGLCSVFLYLIPLFRMYYIMIKLYKREKFIGDTILCFGVLAFLTMTSLTLIITDPHRAFMWPFCISLFEYKFYMCGQYNETKYT